MATGIATISFGSVPGARAAFVDVTGLSGLTSGTYLEAFVMAEASSNRLADDNRIDAPQLISEYLSSSSFRIHGTVPLGEIIGDVPVRWATA